MPHTRLCFIRFLFTDNIMNFLCILVPISFLMVISWLT